MLSTSDFSIIFDASRQNQLWVLDLYGKLFCAEFESVFAIIYRWSVIEASYEHINSLNSIFVYQTWIVYIKTVWFDIKINGSFLNRKSPCSRGVRCPPYYPSYGSLEWVDVLLPLWFASFVFGLKSIFQQSYPISTMKAGIEWCAALLWFLSCVWS
jgi:hypothetical protein